MAWRLRLSDLVNRFAGDSGFADGGAGSGGFLTVRAISGELFVRGDFSNAHNGSRPCALLVECAEIVKPAYSFQL